MTTVCRVVNLGDNYAGEYLVRASMELARRGFVLHYVNEESGDHYFTEFPLNLTEEENEVFEHQVDTHHLDEFFLVSCSAEEAMVRLQKVAPSRIIDCVEVVRVWEGHDPDVMTHRAAELGSKGFIYPVFEAGSDTLLATREIELSTKDGNALADLIDKYENGELEDGKEFFTLGSGMRVRVTA